MYDAWGVCYTIVLDDDATDIANLNPFRYRSYYYDIETNLYFLKTRYYDPKIGRFITIDDISYLAPDTINGLNLYAYCLNNPIIYHDQSGKFWDYVFDAVFIGIGISDFADDPSWSKGLFLAADIVLAIIPVIPAISSVRHINKFDNIIDATKALNKIDNVTD